MILLKYASRHRTNDARAKDILRFIGAVLRATDLETSIAQLLKQYVPKMVLPLTIRKWPDDKDFYAAAEQWVCYCEDAFSFLFEQLNGPVIWNPSWLQDQITPREVRDSIVEKMVHMAQKHFDDLRHQLFLQYGRPHIDAVINGRKFQWARFDDEKNKRIQIDPEDELTEPTVCFVDRHTLERFGDATLGAVRMILVPDGDAEAIFAFIHRFYPRGSVERVVLWFDQQFVADGYQDYRDLISGLCFRFSSFFGWLQQFVVLPPYARDNADVWSGGPLSTFAQRTQVVPHARVVIDPYDLYIWYSDVSGGDMPLPGFLDGAGCFLGDDIAPMRKLRIARVHDLDLWKTDDFYDPPTTKKSAAGATVLLTDAPSTSTGRFHEDTPGQLSSKGTSTGPFRYRAEKHKFLLKLYEVYA